MLNYTNNQFLYTNEKTPKFSAASICGDTLLYGSLRKELAMAGLLKRREKWYARVIWFPVNGRKERQIPLRTESKVTARERLAEVNKVEDDIKQGMEFTFPWLSELVKTKVKRFTLQDAADRWMSKRIGKLAKKTTELNKDGLKYFVGYIGKTQPLEIITTSQMEHFVDWLDGRRLSKTTINMHLRTIKAMFRYYLRVDKLNKIPHIQQLSIRKSDPIYITDDEFQSVMELDWLDDFYKRVFLLYRETGMRLNEPMMSVLEGAWVDIPNTSKGKVGRNIELDKPMQSIFAELKDWLGNGYGSRLKDQGDHFSKMFKKTLRSIGVDESKHFHSLRHTFAVRRLIQGTSIYELKLLMGHSSVTTTEVYSNMNLKRVAQDFPTIVTSYVNDAKIGNLYTDSLYTTIIPTTYMS
jgi:integrase